MSQQIDTTTSREKMHSKRPRRTYHEDQTFTKRGAKLNKPQRESVKRSDWDKTDH